MSVSDYRTAGGLLVSVEVDDIEVGDAVEPLIDALDSARGVLLTSGYEYPGRYSRWDIGFVDPPLMLVGRGRLLEVQALNERGAVLLLSVAGALAARPEVARVRAGADRIEATIGPASGPSPEEQRTRRPSLICALRGLVDLFASPEDSHLGLYGAFGYDLAFQFEDVSLQLARPPDQRDLVLYLPDELIVVDRRREVAERRRYELAGAAGSTVGRAGGGTRRPYRGVSRVERDGDHRPGEYAGVVEVAKEWFRRGDLFEVVPGRTFIEPCPSSPSAVFRRLRESNPSPYGFLISLGDGEHLVGASPEMYVRVDGRRVESCPISGTIARGSDALGDARQIRTLLNSAKDEAELTMCTDVDRNDKSRICEPGSVRVIGRRQIELYSRLIHTVDHVEGTLREGFDALDAFLAHAWAVTVTGAPKTKAMQFIEDHERSPRAWYGGAIGRIGFDGHLNTGLTLRTVRIRHGIAEVRAGATLLSDSDPDAEERETALKASALLDAIRDVPPAQDGPPARRAARDPVRVLVVDHEDSFVNTLADYFRQTGAGVTTLRAGFGSDVLDAERPDLVVLSPGPGRPEDFAMSELLAAVVARGCAVFGVCLGLQGIVEHFGGELGQLPEPVHGKPSQVRVLGGRLLEDLGAPFVAARYHSLYAREVPACLKVTAVSDDRVVMAVEHRDLAVAGVQFHPESILTADSDTGLRLVRNVVERLVPQRFEAFVAFATLRGTS